MSARRLRYLTVQTPYAYAAADTAAALDLLTAGLRAAGAAEADVVSVATQALPWEKELHTEYAVAATAYYWAAEPPAEGGGP